VAETATISTPAFDPTDNDIAVGDQASAKLVFGNATFAGEAISVSARPPSVDDAIAEGIITNLSHFSELFVIARNSSFAYKGSSTDVREIASTIGILQSAYAGISQEDLYRLERFLPRELDATRVVRDISLLLGEDGIVPERINVENISAPRNNNQTEPVIREHKVLITFPSTYDQFKIILDKLEVRRHVDQAKMQMPLVRACTNCLTRHLNKKKKSKELLVLQLGLVKGDIEEFEGYTDPFFNIDQVNLTLSFAGVALRLDTTIELLLFGIAKVGADAFPIPLEFTALTVNS